MTVDKRPDPKPRRYPNLYQAFQAWDEFAHLRIKHGERLRSIEHGKSRADAEYERRMVELTETAEKNCERELHTLAKQTGAVYDWLVGIKGIGPHTAAKLIAYIDDPAMFATVSKLWRFAGYAVIDGKREYREKGVTAHYSTRLKCEVWLAVEQFIRHQTPVYADAYYAHKAKLRELHPEPVKENGTSRYTDMHIHLMAMRKVAKMFLQHLWVTWRTIDGLPVSEPYAFAIAGHDPAHYIAPPTNERNDSDNA